MSSLSWWFAAHPAWEPSEDGPQEVPAACSETDDEIVLIDPFLPRDGSFDPHGKTVRVLLTQGAHHRDTAEVVERYGAAVWTPPHAAWRKIPNPATTDELPAGIEALELDGEPQQVVCLVQEHATLVTGDVLTGRDGVIHVFVDEAHREPLLASLERIAELPIEWVIVPHCESPIFVDGAARIRAAVTIPERRAIRSSRRRNVSYNRCEPMPRNIVTLAPRRLVLPVQRNRAARRRIERALVEKYRARRESDPERIVIDFPKRASRRAAKEEVAAALDQVERRWRRLYVLYPSESSLRERGE